MVAVEDVSVGVHDVEQAWEKAQQDGKWLVAIWRLDEEGKLWKQITTWDFPKGDLAIVEAGMNSFVRQEKEKIVETPAPLPPANPNILFRNLNLDPNAVTASPEDNGEADE